MDSISNMNTINCPNFQSNYRNMKSKFQQKIDDNMYYDMGMNVLLSMFDYDKKIFRPELLDMILHDTGIAALIETDTAKYTPVFCNLVGGNRYADGIFMNAICYDMTGHQYNFDNWRENVDILVFFNNLTVTPDNFIEKYSTMLTDIDTSIMANVLFSRKKPVPIVRDQKTKNQIDAIFSDLKSGETKTLIDESKLHEIINGAYKPIDVLNLTDVESSKYIQYLQNLYNGMVSRLFFHMGLSLSDNGKQAQISIAELNKSKSATLAILNGWYIMRKNMFRVAEQKTGLPWEFDFSDVWKNEIDKMDVVENVNQQTGDTITNGGENDDNI